MDADQLLDREEEMRVAMETVLRGLHVSLPVRVTTDSDGKTVSVKPTIMRRQIMPDGTVKEVEYPDLYGIVRFASGGGLSHTHPIKKDDEGMVQLTSRSFWNWRQLGGTQAQVDARSHDLSDAIYISGIRSVPRDLQGISTSSSQIRTDDKSCLHDVSHDAVTGIRDTSAHQINKDAVQAQKGSSTHAVVENAIQQMTGTFFHNCRSA